MTDVLDPVVVHLKLSATGKFAETAATMPGASVIDLTDLFCDDTTCFAVVGGVIGRNLGSHENRTLATLLGAIGGGLIGHRIEQHHQARTAGYDVAVRMSDGSRRVLQQAEAPSVGQWVRVEGERLVPLDNGNRRLDAVPPMPAPSPSRPQRVPLPTPGGPLDTA